MKRRLFSSFFVVAAILSLLLFVATVVLWVRSHRVYESRWCSYLWRTTDGQTDFNDDWEIIVDSTGGRLVAITKRSQGEDKHKIEHKTAPPGFSYGIINYGDDPTGITPDSFYPAQFRWRGFEFMWNRYEPWDDPTRGYSQRGGWDAVIGMPAWFPALAFAVLPALTCRRMLKKRKRPGFCNVCGYDLRATTTRCPECGAACTAAEQLEKDGQDRPEK